MYTQYGKDKMQIHIKWKTTWQSKQWKLELKAQMENENEVNNKLEME